MGHSIQRLVTFGFRAAASRTIDTIIVHSSYDPFSNNPYTVVGLLALYKNYGVAPHYLIDREGTAYQLVADENIAYHAGDSKVPDGRTDVNNFSIGVEMMNTREDKYTFKQYAALNNLLRILTKRYEIKYVLGHNHVAPGRKDDPWNLDWRSIAHARGF